MGILNDDYSALFIADFAPVDSIGFDVINSSKEYLSIFEIVD